MIFLAKEIIILLVIQSGIFTIFNMNALYVSKRSIEMYLDEKVDKVVLIYNEFKSIIQQKIVTNNFSDSC